MLLMRMVDLLKKDGITSLFTSLVVGGDDLEGTKIGVSSLMDTWLLVRDIETQGERNRGMFVVKSRGMAHSNQIREFLLTDQGVELIDVYIGSAGVLTGAARATQEATDRSEEVLIRQETERRLREIERRQQVREAQIAALRADSESDEEEVKRLLDEAKSREAVVVKERERIANLRKADALSTSKTEGKRGCPK
jgi:circadian clock protein KaiC